MRERILEIEMAEAVRIALDWVEADVEVRSFSVGNAGGRYLQMDDWTGLGHHYRVDFTKPVTYREMNHAMVTIERLKQRDMAGA